MAGWLNGVAELGSILTGRFIPGDQAVGGGVADAVLKYVELGGKIASAIAKSNLKNLNTSRVKGTLSTRLIEVTAKCTTYEICEGGRWVKKKRYSEERKIVDYTDSVTVTFADTAWKEVSVTSRPQSLDPDKAEKYLLKKLLEKLKRNGDGYGKFNASCK